MFRSKAMALALAAVLTVAFAATGLAAQGTIKIGVAGAHSGNLAGYGTGTLNATKIIAEKVNAAGGIAGGRKIEIVAQDEQCKPELASNVASKIISDDIKVVIGHICTGATRAALPLYTEAKVISISPSATAPNLTSSGENPFFFRTIAADDDQARIAVHALEDVIQAKKVAILHDKGEYGKGFADFVREFLEKDKNAEVVLFEGITTGASDFSPIIQKIRSSKADAVVFGGYDPDAAKIVSQMARRRMDIPFVGPDGVRVESYLRLAGASAANTYASGTRDLSSNPLYKEATDLHVKMFGTPPPAQFYMQGYAAMLAAVNAIDKAGGDRDIAKIMEVLRSDYVDTPLGKIRFDAKGDAEGVGFALFKVVDGKFEEVK